MALCFTTIIKYDIMISILLLILLRILLYHKYIMSSLVTAVILGITMLPFSVLWMFSFMITHCITDFERRYTSQYLGYWSSEYHGSLSVPVGKLKLYEVINPSGNYIITEKVKTFIRISFLPIAFSLPLFVFI